MTVIGNRSTTENTPEANPARGGTDDATDEQALLAQIAQLRESLTTRTVIGQATGILCGRLQVSTDTAWEILRRASMSSNCKLRRVAEVIVASHDGHRRADDDQVARAIAPIVGFRLD